MARTPAYERMLKSMRAFFRLVGRSSEGARVVELDGVLGVVCPKVPDRSLPNSVVYESQEALIAALPELDAHYDEAGHRRVDRLDARGRHRCGRGTARRGAQARRRPAAMTIELAGLSAPPEIDYRTGDELMPVVASINDRAYPFDGTPFSDMSPRSTRTA